MIRILIHVLQLAALLLISSQMSSQEIGRGCFGGTKTCDSGLGENVASSEKISLSKNSNNQLILQLSIEKLSPEEQKSLTGGTVFYAENQSETPLFVQEEDLLIPPGILEEVGLNKSKNLLKSGSYPIIIQGHKAYVTFTLYELN